MGHREVTKDESYCDRCGSIGGYLTVCIVCGHEYCLVCRGVTCNAMSQNICRDCIDRDDVRAILMKYLEKEYHPLKDRQKRELVDLPGNPGEEARP